VPDCRPDAEGPARKTDLNWPGDRGIHPAKAGSRRAMPAVDGARGEPARPMVAALRCPVTVSMPGLD